MRRIEQEIDATNGARNGAKNGAANGAPNGIGSIGLELHWVEAKNGQGPLVDEHVFLLGRPSLRQYLSFVNDLAVEGAAAPEPELVQEWRAARAVITQRQGSEAGLADDPPMLPLPERLHPLRDALQRDPVYRNGFSSVPTEVMMVELDRLTVYQKHINLEFTHQIRTRLGPQPSDEDVFRTCIPFDHPQPPVKYMRTGGGTFVFLSPSNDIRYLGSMTLKPENIVGHPLHGAVTAVIGLAVGFGSNFLNAIHCENRLVLNNGSHRAFAMREFGYTHAPCIVQHVDTRDELKAVASGDLRRNPDLYLRGPRPSMLRDYFDPELRKVVPCTRRLRQVRLRYSTDESDLPAV
jgi:hypothetical protein